MDRRPISARRVLVVSLLAGCLAVAAVPAWAALAPTSAPPAAPKAAPPSPSPSPHTGHATPQTPAAPSQQGGQPAQVNALEARTSLEQLLGQHHILTVRLTRARLREDTDLAQTAEVALTGNTADMSGLIESVYGAEAADQFEELWVSHLTYLFNYARGVAENNEGVKAEARAELDEYLTGLSDFLGNATQQAAPAPVVKAGLQTHVDHLVQQADAYAAEDYERAFALEREGYAHVFPLGKALAAGIVTAGGAPLPAEFNSPATELQSRLGMLLGEHAELAVDAMRSGVSNYPDFPAAASALDGNTQDLTAAIESVFGAQGASAFMTLWAEHIDAFVAYTQALASDDAALRDAASARLEQFNTDFAGFLGTATQGRLVAPELAQAFAQHEDLLLQQINAYAEGDYRAAHQLAFEAYQHMFPLAAQAARAIGDTVAAQSPVGGAPTGHGGMASVIAGG